MNMVLNFFETSAKTDTNVKESFISIATDIVTKKISIDGGKKDNVDINKQKIVKCYVK